METAGKVRHLEVYCKSKEIKERTSNRESNQFRGNCCEKPKHRKKGGNPRGLLIEDKPVNVIIDSGANRNLMSEGISEFVTGRNASPLVCGRRVYAYASNKPLQLRSKCTLTVQVAQTRKSLDVEFYITCDQAATLLGRDTSELLGVPCK